MQVRNASRSSQSCLTEDMQSEIMIEEEDTKYTKLFVGGIPYSTKDEIMREYFQQFDEIKEAVIIREKKSRRSKGYGFVTMATEEGAKRACENKRPMIDGREANVDLAYIGAKQPKSPKTSQSDANETTSDPDLSTPAPDSPPSGDVIPVFETVSEPQSTPHPVPNGKHFQTYEPRRKSSSSNYFCESPSRRSSSVAFPTFDVIPTNGPGLQLPGSTLPSLETNTFHQGNVWFSPPSNVPALQPVLNDQTLVHLVTIQPQGPVVIPGQQTVHSAQCGSFAQDQQIGIIPNSGFVYAVPGPVWYIDQGGQPISAVGLDPMTLTSMYHGAHAFPSAGMVGPTNTQYAVPTYLY